MATRRRPAARPSRSRSTIKVLIGRFGQDPVEVNVPKGYTVFQALAEANIVLGATEEVFVNAGAAEATDILSDNNSVINIVGRKAGGR